MPRLYRFSQPVVGWSASRAHTKQFMKHGLHDHEAENRWREERVSRTGFVNQGEKVGEINRRLRLQEKDPGIYETLYGIAGHREVKVFLPKKPELAPYIVAMMGEYDRGVFPSREDAFARVERLEKSSYHLPKKWHQFSADLRDSAVLQALSKVGPVNKIIDLKKLLGHAR